ncbi:MAG: hypothetical protein WCA19_02265 [Candidatus Acidiferrales bacterium]
MLKKILIVALKHAINAAIITGGPLIWDSGHFNFHSWVSFLNVLRVVAGAVVGREFLVWGPVVMKWSSTNDTPPDQQMPGH